MARTAAKETVLYNWRNRSISKNKTSNEVHLFAEKCYTGGKPTLNIKLPSLLKKRAILIPRSGYRNWKLMLKRYEGN